MDTLVSVILPTYNVKPYLSVCLDSLLAQTYENIEIIVVIDGATDGSYEIALEYEKNDARVQVIWQENAGSGPARNNGLSCAKGEYIIFVDPDDYVDTNMVELLLQAQIKHTVDLVVSGYETFYENNSKPGSKTNYRSELLTDTESVRRKYIEYLSKGLLGAPTRKLYRAGIIRENGVCFPDLRRSQDIVFNYRYFMFVSSMYLTDQVFYHYRVDEKQYTLKLKKDYYRTLAFIFDEITAMCDSWKVGYTDKDYQQLADFFYSSIISNIEANLHRKESITEILNNSTIQKVCQLTNARRMDQKLFKIAICCKSEWLVKGLATLKKHIKSY
ncbi:MAG: glycosyltransferase [Eubacteriales bacterium]|nr:glycosyltransferase [Eubacteriales bacterium]